LTAYKITGRNW